MQERIGVEKDAFLSKLPNSTLYSVSPYPRAEANFFDFLAFSDDRSGRASYTEFPYISYNPSTFLNLMKRHMPGCHSFIDVGCGGGDKLAIVRRLYPKVNVWGVEHDPCMAIWARAMVPGAIVICADAFKLHYSNFDLIYAYWPVCDHKLMNKLLDHIIRTKRKAAKLVLVGYRYPDKYERRAKELNLFSGVNY